MTWWEALREVCGERPLERKHLLVPNRRVGRQVLERLARSGTGILNVLPSDLRGFLLGTLCDGFADLNGREYAHRRQLQLITLHSLKKAAREGRIRYFSRVNPSPGLIRSLAGVLQEIRMASMVDAEIREGLHDLGKRGEDLAELLREYEETLHRLNLVDYPGVVAVCLERAAQAPGELERFLEQDLLLVPAFYLESWSRAEMRLWGILPEESKVVLRERSGETDCGMKKDPTSTQDIAGKDEGAEKGDSSEVPQIRADRVEIRGAVGETNEVRGMFRKIVEEMIPLDQVEVVYTDDSTYRPLLLDLSRVFASPGEEEEGLQESEEGEEERPREGTVSLPKEVPRSTKDLPLSLTKGIPLHMTRPGRALLAWLEWLNSEKDPRALAKPVGEGLFRLEKTDNSAAAALLFCLPLEGAPDLDLATYLEKLADVVEDHHDGKSLPVFLDHWLARWGRERLVSCLRDLSSLVRDLLMNPEDGVRDQVASEKRAKSLIDRELSSHNIFSIALRLLRGRIPIKDRADAYARNLLEEELERALRLTERLELDIPSLCFMENLLKEASVLGEGPRPGRLYAAPLEEGGFSGRPYLFILGLDSSRFPRRPPTDPVLPEEDRVFLSSLPQPSPGLDLLRLTEILREERKGVFLSFSRYDLERDEETYPSPALVYITTTRAPGTNEIFPDEEIQTLEGLYRSLGRDLTHAPEEPHTASTEGEWWASAGKRWGTGTTKRVFFRRFPHLKRGHEALQRRSSKDFTEFDGLVPEAGDHLDPFNTESGMVLSAEKLAKMGKNPFDFFLEEVLDLKRPPFRQAGAPIWLDPLEEGTLLHRVFQSLTVALGETVKEDLSMERAMRWAEEFLDEELSWWKMMKPPPSASTHRRKRDEYLRVVRNFAENCLRLLKSGSLILPEIAYGIPGNTRGRTVSEEPVTADLEGGLRIRLRGVVDALEVDPSLRACRVWDYKTGSSAAFRQDGPFQGGRNCQPIVYTLLVEEGGIAGLLPGLEQRVQVAEFLFFFPGLKDHGETLKWDRKELEAGKSVLRELAELMRRGVFPVSDEGKDLEFSPYREVHEDLPGAMEKVSELMKGDERLAPLRRLRKG